MPEDDEYELMPHETIEKIKHELEILKQKAGGVEDISSKEVKQSIIVLNDNISKLLSLFHEAAKDIKEEQCQPIKSEQIGTIMNRMDQLEEENRKIAEGILVVADMVKDVKRGENRIEEEMHTKHKLFKQPQPFPENVPPQIPPVQPKPQPVIRPQPVPQMPLQPRHEFKHFEPSLQHQTSAMPRPVSALPPLPPLQQFPQPGLRPLGSPVPPMQMSASPLPPLPDIAAAPKKKGIFSKLMKR